MGVQRPIQHIHHLPGVVGAHGGKNRGGKPVQIDLAQVGDLPVELPGYAMQRQGNERGGDHKK
ncbi:hypothetical protein D3C73_1285420 [compost metagenome]